jgi:hypothetical protein
MPARCIDISHILWLLPNCVATRSAGPGGCRPLAFWPPTFGASPGPCPAPDRGEHVNTNGNKRSFGALGGMNGPWTAAVSLPLLRRAFLICCRILAPPSHCRRRGTTSPQCVLLHLMGGSDNTRQGCSARLPCVAVRMLWTMTLPIVRHHWL